jgi:hypothetical protein
MCPTLSKCRVLVLLAGILILGADKAVACGNGKLLLEDKFETLDPAWGFDPDSTTRSNGPEGLTYKLGPNDFVNLLNQSGIYDNYEVCAVFSSTVPENSDAYVSVNFWASDYDNQYGSDVFPAQGTFDVYRIQRKKFLSPVSATSNPAIVKGTNATNEISLTVNGNKGTLVINGKKVIDFTGQPPADGSQFGFFVGTGKNDTGPSTFNLKDIQLRELAAAPNP